MFHAFPEYFSIEEKIDMSDNWKEKLFVPRNAQDATRDYCQGSENLVLLRPRCHLHECKKKEEKRPDYEETSKEHDWAMLNRYGTKSERSAGLCYSHFYPYKC